MSAVTNHVAIPFFNRVPVRAHDVMISTFDAISEKAMSLKEAYHFFGNSVKKRGVEGPTYAEFQEWYARVKNGLIDRPHPSAFIGVDLGTELPANPYKPTVKSSFERLFKAQPLSVACEVETVEPDVDRLKQARAIVIAAHHLFEAKAAAGYAPLSISIEDTIVSEALRELLEADGNGMFADATAKALDHALTLLQGGDPVQQDRLLNILTMDMQVELCRQLAKRDTAQSH